MAALVGGLLPGGLVALSAPSAEALPDVVVIGDGHVDVGPYFEDDELSWKVKYHSGGGYTYRDLDQTVFRVSQEGYFRVPTQGTGNRDWETIGYRNKWIHQLPSTGHPNLLWLGFDNSPRSETIERTFDFVFEGVSGPGDVILEGSGNGAPFFTTRASMPRTFAQYGHFHMYWSFTEPGRYCLPIRAKARLKGTGEKVESVGELTIVTHEVDAANVVPCGVDENPPPQATPTAPAQGAVGGTPYVAQEGLLNEADFFNLVPRLEGDELDVDLLRTSGRDSGTEYRPEDVIFYHRDSLANPPEEWPWQQPDPDSPAYIIGNSPMNVGVDMVDIQDDELAGDLTWRIADVQGPGEVSVDTGFSRPEGEPFLSTVPGWETPEALLWPEQFFGNYWSFTEPGTYCVALEWEAEAAGGGALSDEMKLTFVIDDPDQPATDLSAVTPCARTVDDETRVVLDQGHVDLGVRLLDGKFDLSVRDDTGSPATYRSLSGVVGHASSLTETDVPEDPAYAFLGEPGDTAWILPQSQSFDVLWPGWSTEALPEEHVNGPVEWKLDKVRGPGWFTLWIEDGFGPDVLLDSGDGTPDTMPVGLGTHAHANWGFSAPGLYCLDFTVSSTNPAGRALQDSETFMVQVGGPAPVVVSSDDCTDQTVERARDTAINVETVKQTYGKQATVAVDVEPEATGQVQMSAGATTVTGDLVDGRATLAIPARALTPGSRSVTLSYAGVPGQFKPSSAVVPVQVAKAKPRVTVNVVDSTVRRGASAALEVTVRATGVTPSGKVKAEIAGVTKVARLNVRGTATVRITVGPRTPLGRTKATVTYQGDALVNAGRGSARITVLR